MADRRLGLQRTSLLGRLRASMSAAADAWSQPASDLPYNAATTAGRLSRWRPTTSGPNAVVAATGSELVRRSRDMRRNNPVGKRAGDLLATHIIGSGIRPRSLCSNQKTQQAITQLWDDWTKLSDADGTLDFYGQQYLAGLEMITGGETFARMRTRRLSDGLPVPFQVQLIPAEQVPLEYQRANGGNAVQQGIERDPIGARVNYWMLPQHPGDPVPGGSASNISPVPVPAADVCHLFNATDRIGQLRGLPWLASAMTTLQQVGDYMDAELVRKQAAAVMVGFLLQNAEDDMTPERLAQMGQVVAAMDGVPDVVLEPGTMNILKPGQDVKFNEPADLGGSFDPFLRANYRAVAGAAGVLYQELTGDWSEANDRTFRAMFNTFKRQAAGWQFNLVVVQFCQPVWARFMDYAVASGALKQPKSVSDADLRRVAWSPDRWPYINPAQDVQATGMELALGLTSRTAAIAERGDDVETVDQQIAQDRKREAASGIKPYVGPEASLAADGTGVASAGNGRSATPDDASGEDRVA